MQTAPSWKKFTAVIVSLIIQAAGIVLIVFLGKEAPQAAANAIGPLIVAILGQGVCLIVYVVTQGKIDLAKVQIPAGPVGDLVTGLEQQVEAVVDAKLATALMKLPTLGSVAGNPTPPPASISEPVPAPDPAPLPVP